MNRNGYDHSQRRDGRRGLETNRTCLGYRQRDAACFFAFSFCFLVGAFSDRQVSRALRRRRHTHTHMNRLAVDAIAAASTVTTGSVASSVATSSVTIVAARADTSSSFTSVSLPEAPLQPAQPPALSQPASTDQALLLELQRRLTNPKAKTPVKLELIALAVALVRGRESDPKLSARKVCRDAGKASSHSGVGAMADTIQREGLLVIAAVPSSPTAFGLSRGLLVPPSWWVEHLPDIMQFDGGSLEILDGWRAVRIIRGRVNYLDEVVHGEIVYDLPPNGGESSAEAKLRRDTHRQREQEAIRALDPVAAAEHRAKRARLHALLDPAVAAEKLARRAQSYADEAKQRHELRGVLDQLICRVERQAEREMRDLQRCLRPWRCPAGCSADCSRVDFRRQCTPAASTINEAFESEQWRQWREREHVKVIGEFRGPSGYRYGQRMQLTMAAQQEEELAEIQPEIVEISGSEVSEIQVAFFSRWDGKVAPADWLSHWLQHGDHTTAGWRNEYRGVPDGQPDQFGYDCHPVGPSACARRGYCNGKPHPIYVQTCTLKPPVWSPGMICSRAALDPWAECKSCPQWLTVDELRHKVSQLATLADSAARPQLTVQLVRNCQHRTQPSILCLASSVHDQVSDAELSQWTEQLAQASVSLEILSGASDRHHCLPSAAERSRVDAWLAQQAAAIEADHADWEASRQAKAKLDMQSEFEARRGCGLRACSPGVTSQFRRGDIIYHAPSSDTNIPSRIGVVFTVERSYGGSGHGGGGCVPTGKLSLLLWDPESRRFVRCLPVDSQQARGFSLMPPCCGRGAVCPHLVQSAPDRQWPNGDALDLEAISPIPQAFASLLRNELRQPRLQQQRALEAEFKTLLALTQLPPEAACSDLGAEPLDEAGREVESASHGSAGSVAGAESESNEKNGSDSEASEMGTDSDGEVLICKDGPDDSAAFCDSDDAWTTWSDAEDEPAVEPDKPSGGYTFRIGPLGLDLM